MKALRVASEFALLRFYWCVNIPYIMIRRVLTEDWGLVKVLEDLMSFLTRFFLLSESFSYVFYIFGNTSDSENMISGHWIATSTMFQLTQARCERIQYEEEWLGHRKNGDPSQHVFVLMQYTHTYIYIFLKYIHAYMYIYICYFPCITSRFLPGQWHPKNLRGGD